MNFLHKNWHYILMAFGMVFILFYFLLDRIYGGQLLCRIEHFNGFYLLTPRELVRAACKSHSNPFNI